VNPIILVVGARPNFMKMAPLYDELKKRNLPVILLHTGQHYDKNMSTVFFEDLGMPEPDIYLGVGSASHAKQTAKIMIDFEEVCEKESPSIVIVAGDVNSTIACALVATKLSIPVGHVEAGLRSFDMQMPEEINRILTDRISNLLFTPSKDANLNLTKEGMNTDNIKLVGNIMIDSLLNNIEKSEISTIHQKMNIEKGNYALITLHRPSNVDYEFNLSSIIGALESIGKDIPIIFPVHPRTTNMINEFGLDNRINQVPNLILTKPVGYLDFLALMKYSKVVLTDSGGLQEETTALGIPCITLRENTERPITVEEGTNTIVGNKLENIVKEWKNISINGGKSGRIPELWDGKTAERISDILVDYLKEN
jgi:UDP-N-acetylglucosamine 2-epimerase (non-hydrolysing)